MNGAVLRRDVVEVRDRGVAAGARHVGDDHARIAGDVLAHVAGEQPRVDVVAAAGRGADDHGDLPALVELGDRVLRGGGRGRRRRHSASRPRSRFISGPTPEFTDCGKTITRLEPAAPSAHCVLQRITRPHARPMPTTISPSSAAASTAPASPATPPAAACACCCSSRTISPRAPRRPRPSSFTAGLRYLEHGTFGLVREALTEREVLLQDRAARDPADALRAAGDARAALAASCCGSGCFSTTGSAREKSCRARKASTSPITWPASR